MGSIKVAKIMKVKASR